MITDDLSESGERQKEAHVVSLTYFLIHTLKCVCEMNSTN